MEWIKGKPDKPGLVVVQWMNGSDPVELQLVVKLGDGDLYFFPKGNGKPYPLSKSAIHQHIYIPQPVDPDGFDNGCEFTADFDPETCRWSNPHNKLPIWYNDPNAELSEADKKEIQFILAGLNEAMPRSTDNPEERERLRQSLKELKRNFHENLRLTGLEEVICTWPDGQQRKVMPIEVKDDLVKIIWNEKVDTNCAAVTGFDEMVPKTWLKNV